MLDVFYFFSPILWYKNVRLKRKFRAHLIISQSIGLCIIPNFIVNSMALDFFGVIIDLTIVRIILTLLKY